MRFTDLLTLPLVALWQQKTRTGLTTLGVAFGAFVLAASLSINDGVQQTIRREASRDDVLRKIDVRRGGASPKKEAAVEVEGQMSAAKRARLREALVAYHARLNNQDSVDLTPEMLDKLAHIEHVETVEPAITQWGFAIYNGHSENTAISSARPNAPGYQMRLVAGRFFERPTERAAVVSEFLLYRFGITDEKDVENVLGRPIRLEIHRFRQQPGIFVYLVKDGGSERTQEETKALARLSQRLPSVLDQLGLSPNDAKLLRQATSTAPLAEEAEYVEEIPIIGVIRAPSESERNDRRWWESFGGGDVVLPYQTATDFFFRVPEQRKQGVWESRLSVDRLENVKAVFQQVKDLGLDGTAAIEFIERERFQWLLVFGGMTCVAGVALIVAAMGIANTMLMSVLERTREIGIMKAVGAAGAHIQFMFLIEGALIGACGGALGLLMAWGASLPGDAWLRARVAREMNVELREAIFVFPPWLVLTVALFALLTTTLAAAYPAWRAARIDPVAALRHE